MRVSFFGKGGSGKTTMATNFIKYLNKQNKKVLAIDADINVHLGNMLGMDTKYLADLQDEVYSYFEQHKIDNNIPVTGYTLPDYNSKFILPKFDDEFLRKYATYKDNLALLTVGTYDDSRVGYSCFHSKLSGTILLFNHLLDNKDFYVVTDSTAGIDSVGTSMFGVSDINIFVIEPTKKSVQVFKDFLNAVKGKKLNNYVIVNKVEDESDIEYIKSEIDDNYILDYVYKSNDLKKYEQGNTEALDSFVNNNDILNSKILNILDSTDKDWSTYYERQKDIYILSSNMWYSKFHNRDLTQYIDNTFSYDKVIETICK